MEQKVELTVPPVVCTLAPAELAERGLEWSDLAGLSLTSEQIEDGVASTYPLEVADAVMDLANREASCCGSWLNCSAREVDGVIRLELTTRNPEGLAVITKMAGFPA